MRMGRRGVGAIAAMMASLVLASGLGGRNLAGGIAGLLGELPAQAESGVSSNPVSQKTASQNPTSPKTAPPSPALPNPAPPNPVLHNSTPPSPEGSVTAETVSAAEARYKRLLPLYREGVVSRMAVEQARLEYEQALVRYKGGRDRPNRPNLQTKTVPPSRAELTARLQLAKLNYDRVQELYGAGVVTRLQVLKAQQTYQTLQNEYARLVEGKRDMPLTQPIQLPSSLGKPLP